MNDAKTGKCFQCSRLLSVSVIALITIIIFIFIEIEWVVTNAHIAEALLSHVCLTLWWMNKIEFIFRKPILWFAREGNCARCNMDIGHDHQQQVYKYHIVKPINSLCRMKSARFSHPIKKISYCTRRTIQLHSKLWRMCDTKWELLKKVSSAHFMFIIILSSISLGTHHCRLPDTIHWLECCASLHCFREKNCGRQWHSNEARKRLFPSMLECSSCFQKCKTKTIFHAKIGSNMYYHYWKDLKLATCWPDSLAEVVHINSVTKQNKVCVVVD